MVNMLLDLSGNMAIEIHEYLGMFILAFTFDQKPKLMYILRLGLFGRSGNLHSTWWAYFQ